MKSRIVLLSAWGAPVGAAYLKELAKIPDIEISVVYDGNKKLLGEITRIYQERFGDRAPQFEPADSILEDRNVPIFSVENCNSEACLNILKQLEPSLILLGGSGIVKKPLLEIPQLGTLNCHPGILPKYRGCTCVEWAIYEDEPVGATAHFVTEEIDAGDILKKEVMPIYKGDSYIDIRLRMFYFQAELMATAVRELVNDFDGTMGRVEKFDWSKASYYKPIPHEKMEEVYARIAQGNYAFASEGI